MHLIEHPVKIVDMLRRQDKITSIAKRAGEDDPGNAAAEERPGQSVEERVRPRREFVVRTDDHFIE